MGERKFRIGLDIGIGSVGWAVISYTSPKDARIEDFGSRIFVSGEIKGSDRASQVRREFRGVRRLERRRRWRKERLKEYFIKLGLLTRQEIEEVAKTPCQDVFALKVRALDEKVSPEELLQIFLHSANHRGYRDFYEGEADDETFEDEEAAEETRVNKKAAQDFDRDFAASGCRTISEYLWKKCRNPAGQIDFRNRKHREELRLIRRRYVEKEVSLILTCQSRFYRELSPAACEIIPAILFAQRFFEDGPGNKNDPNRRYTGFLDKLGACPFYPRERRGFRNTVLADVYAVVNALSQYRYQGQDGQSGLPAAPAREIIETLLQEGSMNITMVKAILKKHRVKLFKSAGLDEKALEKANKFLRPIKRIAEAAGIPWKALLEDEPLSYENPPLLHRLGEVLAKYKTPKYRNDELKKVVSGTVADHEDFCRTLAEKPFSGASSCSYHYMHDAVEAFMAGELYGDFQARRIEEETAAASQEGQRFAQLPASLLKEDEDIRDNPVVYRAINEARRVVNAIIRTYGAPECINVEVGRDLGRSFLERQQLEKSKIANERKREQDKEKIAEILQIDKENVTGGQIERYRLYKEQDGKCLYSGNPIDIKAALDTKGAYEVDHIIPYSLILDNTLHNKVLVEWDENRRKGQRTPLMYMNEEQKTAFLERVNGIFSKKGSPWSKKKYEYLLQESLYTDEARQLLTAWKSRNINDMRYITKYVFNLFQQHLQFAPDGKGERAIHVHAIRGAITSRFRRTWLNPKTWGTEDKDRKTYLNHAADAVVLANLTPAYIEIASDNMRLQQMFRRYHKSESAEYNDYLERAVRKMKTYYGFSEEYTRSLLRSHDRVPSFIGQLAREVDIRFNDLEEERFAVQTREFYGEKPDFIIPPHMPLTSHKAERRYRGMIADANPIKVRVINGEPYKIMRKSVLSIKAGDLENLYTNDRLLKETLQQMLGGQEKKYTVEKYLKEHNLSAFSLPNGTFVYKVSVVSSVISNFYRKDITDGNYSMMGGLKYYCVEIYQDHKGKNRCRGIRFIDIVRKNKKLYLKEDKRPENYKQHVMYLFAGDYIEAFDARGKCYLRGTYCSVDSIRHQRFYFKCSNASETKSVTLKAEGIIKKYSIDLLGHKGGEVKCSVPLSSIPAKD